MSARAKSRVLWVEGSPKGDDALSSQLAQAYLDVLGGDVERFSVWSDDVLHFGRDAAIVKFATLFGEPVTDDQARIWSQVLAEIERVREFDRLVVSSPMWNWNVPHALKAWIDVIVQPVASFTLNERGEHVGALGEGKPLQLILTRSSAYDGRHPELQDFQRPYLEYVFTMLATRYPRSSSNRPRNGPPKNASGCVLRPSPLPVPPRWLRGRCEMESMPGAAVTYFFQKRVANPLMRRLPTQTLLETIGRTSGEPRRTPLGGRLEAGQFWFVSEFGEKSQYVRNIQADPRVRVRVRGKWHRGTAHLLPDDDPEARLRQLPRMNGVGVRTFGTNLMTVRVDLDAV